MIVVPMPTPLVDVVSTLTTHLLSIMVDTRETWFLQQLDNEKEAIELHRPSYMVPS